MAKMAYALMSIIIIEMALYFFAGTDYSNTTLMDLVLNPSIILNNAWYIAVAAALVIFAASAIIPGSFVQINIYALYAGLASAALTFTAVLVDFWTFLNGSLSGINQTLSSLILGLTIVPLIIFYITAIVEWVRQN